MGSCRCGRKPTPSSNVSDKYLEYAPERPCFSFRLAISIDTLPRMRSNVLPNITRGTAIGYQSYVTPERTTYALLSDVNNIAIDASDTSMPMRYRFPTTSFVLIATCISRFDFRAGAATEGRPYNVPREIRLASL